MVQKPCRIGYMLLFPFIFVVVFRSEWICCPFKNTESDITLWDSHINRIYAACKIGFECFDPILYLDLIIDDYRIGSTKIGRGLVGAGGELGLCPRGLRCALAARTARLRRALAARARLQLLHKIYEFIHGNCKNIYEFIHNMNSYLYEFIYLKCKIYMNSYMGHPK
jgi:hypothetical protein